MGLFSDICNTVAKFFRPQEEQGDASKSVATNRLKLVLMQDRTNLTPKILEQMRGELIDLLSRYVELDKELLELNFEHEGDQVALMLSIPVIRAKDEEEIEAALRAEAEKIEAELENKDAKVEEDASEGVEDENSSNRADEGTENSGMSTPEDMNTNKTQEEQEEVKEECQG